VAGFGTVGQALLRLVQHERERLARDLGVELAVSVIANRDVDRKRAAWAGDVRWTSDVESLATAPDVDLVVELMGGLEPANTLLRAAFANRRGVVTANKMLLASHGGALAALAAANGAPLGLEAAVAGGIPILRAVRESFAGDTLTALSGILNGTCNFILTEMEKTGRAYADVLLEAQRLGYAEADPTSDVEGADAGYKLVLLSRMAFGQEVPFDAIFRDGIARLLPYDFVYAQKLDRSLRQLASCRRLDSGKLLLSVRTHLVSKGSILSRVEGPFNAVQVTGRAGGDFVFYGRGAGGDPTATAVLADIVEIARSGARPNVPPLGFSTFQPFQGADPEDFVAPFYLRFVVKDRPGIIADLSRILANHAINIDAVFQAPYPEKDALPFVITLEPVSQAELSQALAEIARLDFHTEPPLALPMTP